MLPSSRSDDAGAAVETSGSAWPSGGRAAVPAATVTCCSLGVISEWGEAKFRGQTNMIWSVPFRHDFPNEGIRFPLQAILAAGPRPGGARRAPTRRHRSQSRADSSGDGGPS